MSFTLRLDIKEFETKIARLKRPGAPIVRALNRTINSARTAVVRAVSQDTGLKVSDVRKYITVSPATYSTPQATIRASAKRLPLILFGAKGREPSRGKPPGVRAKLAGGRGTYPHAFITTVGQGRHRGVFVRRGAKRLPIVELRGPSIWQAYQKHAEVGVARAHEQLTKNLAHEIEFELSR